MYQLCSNDLLNCNLQLNIQETTFTSTKFSEIYSTRTWPSITYLILLSIGQKRNHFVQLAPDNRSSTSDAWYSKVFSLKSLLINVRNRLRLESTRLLLIALG